jgi:hypothetical protein
MSASPNLWGNYSDLKPIKTPIAIIKEQASVLREITNGILLGSVQVQKGPNNSIEADLRIIAPALGDYVVSVLGIKSGLNPYPVSLRSYQSSYEWDKIPDEPKFIEALQEILSSEPITKVIASLISQSKAL